MFLRPFVEDLKHLYCNGILVTGGSESKVFHGGLIAFLANTLAAHQIGRNVACLLHYGCAEAV